MSGMGEPDESTEFRMRRCAGVIALLRSSCNRRTRRRAVADATVRRLADATMSGHQEVFIMPHTERADSAAEVRDFAFTAWDQSADTSPARRWVLS
jgi:hypothetical protein